MVLKEILDLPKSTECSDENLESNSSSKLKKFDNFVCINFDVYRNRIRVEEAFECIEFKSMAIILNAMIEEGVFQQEDRKVIYSFREEHNENLGCSYFKYGNLPKLSRVLKK